MIVIKEKFKSAERPTVRGQLQLSYESRQKRWLRTRLLSGEDFLVQLPRAEMLRGGDLLLASDEQVIEVLAAPERVLHVVCATASELARAAYHLGNRHVPVQIGSLFLRIQENHVLEEMLRGLGAAITRIEASFEPETGPYSQAHHRRGDREQASPAIHEYDRGAPYAEKL